MYRQIPVMAVTNRKLCETNFLEQIERLAQTNLKGIILREKDLSETEYKELAEQVLRICKKNNKNCVLHTFVDVALELGAEQIHLPLSVAEQQREKIQAFREVGISTHSIDQVRSAEALGAYYVTYGHVFATDCKKGVPPRGIEALREICAATKIPVYAIGGITTENAEQVMAAGAAGICQMSEAMRADFYFFRVAVS